MIKKILSLLLTICFLALCFTGKISLRLHAEDCDPDSDDYYACILTKTTENIDLLEKEIEEANKNISSAQLLATEYAQEVEELQEEINDLNISINNLQERIDYLITEINDNEERKEELNTRIKAQMVEAQGTMHFNQYIDFILGSTGFADMLRRTYAVEAIGNKQSADLSELKAILAQLESDKAELDEAMENLQVSKQALIDKQAVCMVKQEYYLQVVIETREQRDAWLNELEEQKQTFKAVRAKINEADIVKLVNTSFSSPVPGARITSGFPYYPDSFGGGIHLGVDYGVKEGTNIYAPVNGIITVSENECRSNGYLGNTCPAVPQNGGAPWGGNQIYLMFSLDNKVYCITFSHLQYNSAHETGIVIKGEVIGKVGSTGNSTGPHAHIEVFYLGEGNAEELYLEYLEIPYSSSFNCGWGSTGYRNICSNKGSAPCRIDPRELF